MSNIASAEKLAQIGNSLDLCTNSLQLPLFSGGKSRIRESKHLSTDADSCTNTTVAWTKNTQNPFFFEKRKKSSKTQKLQNV